MSFFEELKRRNVFRVAIAYIIVAWLLLQISDTLAPALRLPEWFHSGVAFILILGFPIAIIFAWAFEMTPEGLKREREVDREASITHSTGRKLDFFIIGLLAVALGYFIWEARFKDDLPSQTAETAEIDKSIAVLPFVNMSNDPDQEYFSDGISEELLNVLAQYPDLRVAARTSSFQFKNHTDDVTEIAKALRVNHILEGSVRKSGNTVRITAQLIETDTGYHLWSDTYDRQLDDIFAIQDEISASIGEALRTELALADGSDLPVVSEAANAAAFDAYIHGRQIINSRSGMTQAEQYLEDALSIDPDYAPAHAQLAILAGLLSNTAGSYGSYSVEEVARRAIPHIERALELNDRLPEAYAARALLNMIQGKNQDAVDSARIALELNPSYVDALNWMNIALSRLGSHKELTEGTERLLRVDPLSTVGRFNYVDTLVRSKKLDDAREQAQIVYDAIPITGLFAMANIAYAGEGNLPETLSYNMQVHEIAPSVTFGLQHFYMIFGFLDLLHELHPDDDLQVAWGMFGARQYAESADAFSRLVAEDPSNSELLYQYADSLQLAGEIEKAQGVYEQLLELADGRVLIHPDLDYSMPTARAAFGRRYLGDSKGAERLLETVIADQRLRREAGYNEFNYYRTEAFIQAMNGALDKVPAIISLAIDGGLRDPSVFDEAAFSELQDDPAFLEQKARLESIIAEQREAFLRLWCFDNPAPQEHPPSPATCAGVVGAD